MSAGYSGGTGVGFCGEDSSLEFFLMLRQAKVPRATILRQWTFQPRDVIKDGPVRATLQYNATTRTATVKIMGLKTPVEETVETSR